MNNSLLVIIPCAGIGNRFSSQIEKQHASLGDLSVIETTLDTFMMFKPASKIVVVVKDPESFQKKISIKLDERFSIVSGGNSRSESVLNGIRSENIEKSFVPKRSIDSATRRQGPMGGQGGSGRGQVLCL